MRINYMSDLHMEFSPISGLPGGDVLILAGDITVGNSLNENKTDRNSTRLREDTNRFMLEEASKYTHVIAIAGNHEYYHGNMNLVNEKLISFYSSYGAHFLCDGACVDIEDVSFIGGTKWTDFNRQSPIAMDAAQHGMNDFRIIHKLHPTETYADGTQAEVRFLTEDAVILYQETMERIKGLVEMDKEKKVVVVTHHAPSNLSSNLNRYHPSDPLNGAYYSDESEFILSHDNIKFWIHGHMHSSANYMIGGCNVVANPRGYIPFEPNPDFLLEASFDV